MPVPVKMPSTAAADALKTGLMPLLEKNTVSKSSTNSSTKIPQAQTLPEHKSDACLLDSVDILDESKTNSIVTPPPSAYQNENSCEKVSITCDCSHNKKEDPIKLEQTVLAKEPCDDLDSDKHNLLTRSVAGGLAGLVEHLAIYPFDTLRTNTQTGLRGQIQINSWMKWYATRQAWSGVNALIPACTVAHALQFPCIEYTEKFLEKQSWASGLNSSFTAGILGILPHDCIMNPANVVKQRMQLVNQTNKKGWFQVGKELYKSQGIRVFYRSLPAQYAVGSIYMGTFYLFYNDILKNSINKAVDSQTMERNWFMIWLVKNMIATSIAVTITQPIDLVVTRVNVGYGDNGRTTIRSSVNHLWKHKHTMMNGWSARMSCSLPASILTWGTYEAIKYILRDD